MSKDFEKVHRPSSANSEILVTSTPVMKSEMGRKLLLKHFVANLQDISMLKESEQSPEVKPFVFRKEAIDSPKLKFHTPKTISPETLRKYRKMFDKTPKPNIKRIRL